MQQRQVTGWGAASIPWKSSTAAVRRPRTCSFSFYTFTPGLCLRYYTNLVHLGSRCHPDGRDCDEQASTTLSWQEKRRTTGNPKPSLPGFGHGIHADTVTHRYTLTDGSPSNVPSAFGPPSPILSYPVLSCPVLSYRSLARAKTPTQQPSDPVMAGAIRSLPIRPRTARPSDHGST